jgi:tetratricopeptide (TPR) repeat protein
MKRSHILLCLLLAGSLTSAQDQPPSAAPAPAEGETIVPPNAQISEAAARRELARLRQRARQRAIGPAVGKPSTRELVDTRIGQAESLAGDRRYDEALKLLAQLRAEYPGDTKVMLAQARVLSWSQRFKESIQAYSELGKLTPGDPTVWKELARVAIWNRQMSLARESYAKIYTPSVDEKLAETLKRSGHDQVIPGGAGVAPAKEKAPYEQYERVRQLLDSGQLPPGSRPAVKAALSALQSDYRIQKAAWLESSARRQEWNGRLIHAQETYQELLAFRPDKPDYEQALSDLAGVQTSQGLSRASTATYQQLLQLEPSSKIAAEALELKQIHEHPGLFAEYNYFDEKGTSRNADIAIQRFQSGGQFFWNSQTRLRIGGNYWFVEPGSGPHADAAGPTIGINTVFNEYWRASAEWTNKQYYDAPFSATNTGRADLAFNAWDYVHLTLQYARLDVLDNNFALQQGVQADNVSLLFNSDLTHNVAVSGTATWIHYTDHNEGVWLLVEPKFLLLDRPQEAVNLILRGEYRNTRDLSADVFQGPRLVNIIHPYWTPDEYTKGSVILEWRQEFLPLLFAGDQQHYFALRVGGGFDSTGNKNVFVEGAWHYDFLKHWTLEARGTVDRSPAWDGAFATMSLIYRF